MNHERVEFTTIRDDFSIFQIENGQILKAKVTLVDVVNISKKETEPEGRLSIQPYSYVITPPKTDISGMEVTGNPVTDEDVTKEVQFEKIKEVLNIYETKKSIILVGLKMEKIFLTNKMNDNKEPVLRYQSINGFDVMLKPEFKKPANEKN